jgi:hypothetical protein
MRLCGVPGCNKKHYARDLCFYHWRKWRESPDYKQAPPKTPDKCERCELPAKARGLCSNHYIQKWRKTNGTNTRNQSRNHKLTQRTLSRVMLLRRLFPHELTSKELARIQTQGTQCLEPTSGSPTAQQASTHAMEPAPNPVTATKPQAKANDASSAGTNPANAKQSKTDKPTGRTTEKNCKYPGCDRIADAAKGLCNRCYKRTKATHRKPEAQAIVQRWNQQSGNQAEDLWAFVKKELGLE